MKFKVHSEVFVKMPNLCFGVVIAYGIDNSEDNDYINSLLLKSTAELSNELTSINGIMDLVSALSAKYVLPIEAHDMDALEDWLVVALSKPSDVIEALDAKALVYTDSMRIWARRCEGHINNWACITKESSNIIFTIMGFTFINKESVIDAMEELGYILTREYGCLVKTEIIDKDNYETEIY